MAEEGSAPAPLARAGRALGLFAAAAAVLLAALAVDALGIDGLVHAMSALFVAVYVTSTAAGVRLLSGGARTAAAVALAAVVVILAFSGPFLLVTAAVAAAALVTTRRRPVVRLQCA